MVTQDTLWASNPNQPKMPATKIKAFLNEYPFILDLLDNNVIQQVFVSRINPELINRTLHGEVVDDGIFESRLVNETQE